MLSVSDAGDLISTSLRCYRAAVRMGRFRVVIAGVVASILAATLSPAANAITNPDLAYIPASEAPWMVSLWQIDGRFDRKPNGYACGGVLISPYTVLTAAHCIDSVSDTGFVVVASQKNSSSRGEIGQPRKVTFYPHYRTGSFLFDLAVIDLYAPLNVESYPRVATNPEVTYLLRKPSVLYGWGENERKRLPTTLRRVVQYDQSKIAKKWFPDFLLRTQFAVGRINRNGSFSGACNLDSGSPLIGMVNGRQVVMGLASYGSLKSCTTKTPRVFTRASWFGPWIAKVQAEQAAERTALGIDYTGAFFFGTESQTLPASTGAWAGERTFISSRATFGIETALPGTSDVAAVDSYALTPTPGGDDFVIDVTTRTPWSADPCQWRDLAINNEAPQLSLSLLKSTTGAYLSGYRFSFSANAVDCFGDIGSPMTVTPINGMPALANCAPRLAITSEGALRITLQQGCFIDTTKTMLRVQLSTSASEEVEPGLDSWAGPFYLVHPART